MVIFIPFQLLAFSGCQNPRGASSVGHALSEYLASYHARNLFTLKLQKYAINLVQTPTLDLKMSEPKHTPLWRAIREAYGCSAAPSGNQDDWTERDGFAAEIRALRDWLLPEEEVNYKALFSSLPANRVDYALALQGGQRQALREILTAEAERAERGE